MTMQKPRARTIYFAISLFTLLCGVAIYPLFRGPNLLVWGILPRPAFWGSWQMPYPKGGLASVLAGSGPDCLWFLSGILFLRFIWFYRTKIQKGYILFFYGIGAVIEIIQLSEKIPGTFDLLDLFFMGIGAFLEALLHNFLLGEHKERKS